VSSSPSAAVTTATDTVDATLARYGRMTSEAISRFLDDLRRRAPAFAEQVAEYPLRPGKAIRPSLVLATCQAFGGSLRDAMGPAVSIEMLHNAFLVHDDIEDGSTLRRGRPTLHRLHGTPLAINAGDALAMLALRPLYDHNTLGSRLQSRVVEEYLSMAQHTVEGQARELAWRRDNNVDFGPDDYLELVGAKTCWYTTIYPLRIGALVGSRGTADLEALSRFGFYLGAAFQIRDDLLNLTGTTADIGKEPLGDLREGKRTLMLSHVLHHSGPAQRDWIVRYLGTPDGERSDDDVDLLRALIDEHRGIEFAADYAEGIADAAHRTFAAAFAEAPSSAHVEFLRGMVGYMLERTR
jgi:geranylgeranyl diphosphate synthase, type II